MKTNLEVISTIIDYIDDHLGHNLDLERVAAIVGYSKYHLHRMFTNIVGHTMHGYVKRRRLTEAARLLVQSDIPILNIALDSGYETQQSFTSAFRNQFQKSPQVYRKQKKFYPLQLKLDTQTIPKGSNNIRIENIRYEQRGSIFLAGFKANTKRGFFVIGRCWHKLHANIKRIPGRIDYDYQIGLNDYTCFVFQESKQPAFDYYASIEVNSLENIPSRIAGKVLPPSKYVVFSFRGRNQDSIEPVISYIYKIWFAQSTLQFNEQARFDFVKYGENMDGSGISDIEVWVPII